MPGVELPRYCTALMSGSANDISCGEQTKMLTRLLFGFVYSRSPDWDKGDMKKVEGGSRSMYDALAITIADINEEKFYLVFVSALRDWVSK
jgi:hypothetical protein